MSDRTPKAPYVFQPGAVRDGEHIFGVSGPGAEAFDGVRMTRPQAMELCQLLADRRRLDKAFDRTVLWDVDACISAFNGLKAACMATHQGGPGTHAKCICGAANGGPVGSRACAGLREIRNTLDDVLREHRSRGALSRGTVYFIESIRSWL